MKPPTPRYPLTSYNTILCFHIRNILTPKANSRLLRLFVTVADIIGVYISGLNALWIVGDTRKTILDLNLNHGECNAKQQHGRNRVPRSLDVTLRGSEAVGPSFLVLVVGFLSRPHPSRIRSPSSVRPLRPSSLADKLLGLIAQWIEHPPSKRII